MFYNTESHITSHTLSYYIFLKSLWVQYWHPHIIDEEMEAQRGEESCSSFHSWYVTESRLKIRSDSILDSVSLFLKLGGCVKWEMVKTWHACRLPFPSSPSTGITRLRHVVSEGEQNLRILLNTCYPKARIHWNWHMRWNYFGSLN